MGYERKNCVFIKKDSRNISFVPKKSRYLEAEMNKVVESILFANYVLVTRKWKTLSLLSMFNYSLLGLKAL